MLNKLRIFLPHSLPPILFLLFLLWRLSDGDSMVMPIGLQVSSASEELYRKYLKSTCRKGSTEHNDVVARAHEYLNWEENAFLEQLRIKLEPKTAEGDLSSLYGRPEFKIFDYRILSAKVTSECKKSNDTKLSRIEAIKKESALLEDEIVNRVFNHP
ncbi:unnamed protein product, partial [Mesorhabditis belari]|uniref:Uncharacterized protein n=1 Tax=Mesorhabditis belari TaxID=2138241 RepID=A0AAF3EEU7_9BILA